MPSRGFNGFTVTGQVKAMFFDRMRVINAISDANRKKLSKAGAYIRQRARSSLRRRKKPSKPGQPPSVHSRDTFMNLRNVLFALHDDLNSVIVGPRAVPSLKLKESSAAYVPELMEFGGTSVTKTGRRAHYAARPFMGPALEKEVAAGTIADFWVNRG